MSVRGTGSGTVELEGKQAEKLKLECTLYMYEITKEQRIDRMKRQ